MNWKRVGFVATTVVMLGAANLSLAADGKAKHHAPAAKPAPTIAFSSPADESNVSATIPVRAVASQVDKVHSVTFYVDGVQLANTKGPGGSFKWDTTKVGDGWHTLTAVGKDANGKSTEAQLAVMVHNFVDKNAPTIAITWPTDGDPKTGWLTTRVHATDNIAVTSVETYIDGKLVATSSTAPFNTKWDWNKLPKGHHTIQCKAYDAAGNTATSPSYGISK